jgi:hypothetical protein
MYALSRPDLSEAKLAICDSQVRPVCVRRCVSTKVIKGSSVRNYMCLVWFVVHIRRSSTYDAPFLCPPPSIALDICMVCGTQKGSIVCGRDKGARCVGLPHTGTFQ